MMFKQNRGAGGDGDEHQQVFRKFAWNIAGTLAKSGNAPSGRRTPSSRRGSAKTTRRTAGAK